MQILGDIIIGVGLGLLGLFLKFWLPQFLRTGPRRRTKFSVLLGIFAVFSAFGSGMVIVDNLWVGIGLAGFSLLFIWSCLGTAFSWPGFEKVPNERDNLVA